MRSYEAEVKRQTPLASSGAPTSSASTIAEEDERHSSGDIADDWALIGSAGEDQGTGSSSAASKRAVVLTPGPAAIKPLSKPPPKVPGSSSPGGAPVAAVVAAAVESGSGSLPPKYTLAILEAAGVPTVEERACVLELAQRLGCVPGQVGPLCDPLTLLRFCRSRDLVLDDALHMYHETIAWRAQFGLGARGVPAGVPGVMQSFGHGAEYALGAAVGGAGTAGTNASYGCPVPGQLLAAGAAAESRAAAGLPLQGSFAMNASTVAPGDSSGDSGSGSVDSGLSASVTKAPQVGTAAAAAAGVVPSSEVWPEAEAFQAMTSAAKRAAALDALPVVSAFGGDERSPGSSPRGPVRHSTL